jgi:hypothetical protein
MPWGRVVMMLGAGVVVVSVVGYLVGLLLNDPTPVCGRYVSYCPSAREEWVSDKRSLMSAGVVAGAFVGWSGLSWRFLSREDGVRKVLSILGLVVLVPVALLSGVLSLTVLNTTCDQGAFMCFSGPEAATVAAVPALCSGALALLLGCGLAWSARPAGRFAGTLGLVIVSGTVVAATCVVVCAVVLSTSWTG